MLDAQDEPNESTLLEEYKLCESIIQNQNRINSTYESIFLTGSLAATGFVLQNPTAAKMLAVVAISAVVLFGGLALLRRSKEIQQVCYDRMDAIEDAIHLGSQGIQHKLNGTIKGRSQLEIFTIIIGAYLCLLLVFTVFLLLWV